MLGQSPVKVGRVTDDSRFNASIRPAKYGPNAIANLSRQLQLMANMVANQTGLRVNVVLNVGSNQNNYTVTIQ